jgi:membrane-bound lytic murein transglycosylase B
MVKFIAMKTLTIFILGIFCIFGMQSVMAETLTPAERAALQEQLKQVEAEEAQAKQALADAQSQSQSLSRDINVLSARIKATQLEIKAKNLLIQSLSSDIVKKEDHLDELEARINKGKATLAGLMRKTREVDDYSIPEVLLSQKSIAGFFEDIDSFQSVESGLKTVFEQLRADEAATTEERDALDTRKNAEVDARYAIQQKEASIKSDQVQKQTLLNISKGNEKAYSDLVSQKKAQAVKIRSALFELRDSAAIPFGQALQYANEAYEKTGVRPAFLLAIITQESALGSNVGACYVTNNQTGDGVNRKTNAFVAKVMSPTRDIPPFLSILSDLGTDQTKVVVSCPLSYGWGGAMGPAQFIPSTWMLFKDRIVSALGISGIADPWNPEHAFMASAMYLSDLGAGRGGYTAERTAACKYYSGKACGYATGNTSYGNSVISRANTIQTTMIDPLAGI